MIVCICRNINQARVLKAIEDGAECAHEVHPKCGAQVNCGSCLDTIDDMIVGAKYALSRAAQ